MLYLEEQVRGVLRMKIKVGNEGDKAAQASRRADRASTSGSGKRSFPEREAKKPDLETKLNAAHRCFSLRRKGTIRVQRGWLFKVEPIQMEEEAPRRIQADESGKEESGVQEQQEGIDRSGKGQERSVSSKRS